MSTTPTSGAAAAAVVAGSTAATADDRKAAFIADQMAKNEEKVKKTTTARPDEFLVQSGKERNVVHSRGDRTTPLAIPFNGFMFSPVHVATLRLRRCRESAIRLMKTTKKKGKARRRRQQRH